MKSVCNLSNRFCVMNETWDLGSSKALADTLASSQSITWNNTVNSKDSIHRTDEPWADSAGSELSTFYLSYDIFWTHICFVSFEFTWWVCFSRYGSLFAPAGFMKITALLFSETWPDVNFKNQLNLGTSWNFCFSSFVRFQYSVPLGLFDILALFVRTSFCSRTGRRAQQAAYTLFLIENSIQNT